MKTADKIALTYTSIVMGVIVFVAVVFYISTSFYLEALTREHEGMEAIRHYGSQIRQGIAWMLIGLIGVSSLLVYWVGRRYSARMIERIDSAYQSEKAFVRSASHELNNPLTAIQGECEITLLKERTPLEYQIALGRVLNETKRIIQLMRHLLFLSRGDDDLLRNTTESIFLAEFLRQFVEGRIEYSPDHFSFVVQANPQLLKIAIENILNNALKYSTDSKVVVRLRGNELEVEDQGIGIPAEDLEHIFQPFFRAGNTHGYAGHGIGLALSLRILSAYGATITVYSELNVGTRVTIIFP